MECGKINQSCENLGYKFDFLKEKMCTRESQTFHYHPKHERNESVQVSVLKWEVSVLR